MILKDALGAFKLFMSQGFEHEKTTLIVVGQRVKPQTIGIGVANVK